jgi:hypothetical protein
MRELRGVLRRQDEQKGGGGEDYGLKKRGIDRGKKKGVAILKSRRLRFSLVCGALLARTPSTHPCRDARDGFHHLRDWERSRRKKQKGE